MNHAFPTKRYKWKFKQRAVKIYREHNFSNCPAVLNIHLNIFPQLRTSPVYNTVTEYNTENFFEREKNMMPGGMMSAENIIMIHTHTQ